MKRSQRAISLSESYGAHGLHFCGAQAVEQRGGEPFAVAAIVERTARRLFEGLVRV
jgi:2-methylaconitate cis-trans-isomerase PrpF